MPPWQYAAQSFGEPVEVFTTPSAMLMWTEWSWIIKAAEKQLAQPVERTTETF